MLAQEVRVLERRLGIETSSENAPRLTEEVAAFTAAWLKKLRANGHKPHPSEESAGDLHAGLKRELLEYYDAYWCLNQEPDSERRKAQLLDEALDVAAYLLFECMHFDALPKDVASLFSNLSKQREEELVGFYETIIAGLVESAGGHLRISQAQLEEPRDLWKGDDPETGEWIYRTRTPE